MSDSIIVRVGLDSYDFVHPAEKQTAVHVQIPEVARATYLLPAEMFHGLKDRAWPQVLDVAHQYYADSGMVSDSASAAARSAVWAWFLEDPNRDEMQASFEVDHARRDPVARRLLEENEELRARVAELETERHSTNESLDEAVQALRADRARIAELEQMLVDAPLAVTLTERAVESADRLTRFFAPTQALREDSHDGPLRHSYLISRDLPESGGVS